MASETTKKITYPIIAVYLVFATYFAALFIANEMKYRKVFKEKALGILVHDSRGNKILVDAKDYTVSGHILDTQQWEPHISNILKKVTKPGQTVISLGGHIGYHAIGQSQNVGATGRVYCFEPNPDSLKFLRANVALNNLGNITIFDKAAYNTNGVLKFAATQFNTGGSHVIAADTTVEDHAKEIAVSAVRLDDALKDVSDVAVLQMDIEGSEPNAVYGAKELIQRSPNLVVVQEWNVEFMSKHSDVVAYIKFWRDLGYRFAKILDNGVVEMSDQQLLATSPCDVIIAKGIKNNEL